MNLSIKEKVYGALFGYAIGDALGLGTEFMTYDEAKKKYPAGLTHYSQIIRDAHRSQWRRGEWSNDTEVVKIILDSFIRKQTFDYLDISRTLKDWYDTDPTDLTINLRMTLSQTQFANSPFESTKKIRQTLGKYSATSECLGRAIFTFLSDDYLQVAEYLCKLTHPNEDAYTACKVIAAMSHRLFHKGFPATYDSLIKIAGEADADMAQFVEKAHHGSLHDIDLDDSSTGWFVKKALAGVLWSAWHSESFESGLFDIIAEGGDADTNAASAGALLGIKFGYSSIPQNLIDDLIGKENLATTAQNITDFLINK